MATISRDKIYEIAKKVKEYVEKNYEIPSEVDGVRHGEYTYLLCQATYKGNSAFNRKGVGMAYKPVGDTLNRKIYKSDYVRGAKKIVEYVDVNGKLPNTLVLGDAKIDEHLYEYMYAKIVNYQKEHNQLPAYVEVNSSALIKPEPPKPSKTYAEKVYDWFCDTFNCKPTCFDDCLEYIDGKGYGYYYDDQYSNQESIRRMKKGLGVNCTDACHVYYNLAVYFIQKGKYKKVQCIHVMCRGGDGHVRLRIQLNNGDYFYRDPASVLDGNGVESNWCMNGTVVAYDPSWFMANLYR